MLIGQRSFDRPCLIKQGGIELELRWLIEVVRINDPENEFTKQLLVLKF